MRKKRITYLSCASVRTNVGDIFFVYCTVPEKHYDNTSNEASINKLHY